MFARVRIPWALLVLSCMSTSKPSTVVAQSQSLLYQFTIGVTSPAPIPGQPFTFTWTGGESTEAVYIVYNDYFAPNPNLDIVIESTTILGKSVSLLSGSAFLDLSVCSTDRNISANAPNNGSWTYNVPLNIPAGRHSFSIGYNPFQLSDQTPIFTILSSQTSYVAPAPSSSNPAAQTYNGCGLPPVPGYTYTGYQAPCTVTTSGHVETIYPIVPTSDSSAFFGIVPSSVPASSTVTSSTSSRSINTAFATGVYAQALQCPTPVTPSTTKITASGATIVFSTVGCATASSGSNANSVGVCHTSGYTTFSVSGTSSVCCPNEWATTLLIEELFCFTSMAQAAALQERQASTETVVTLTGLAFTSAGIVSGDAVAGTGSSTATGSATSATTTKSGGAKLNTGFLGMRGIVVGIVVLCYLLYN